MRESGEEQFTRRSGAHLFGVVLPRLDCAVAMVPNELRRLARAYPSAPAFALAPARERFGLLSAAVCAGSAPSPAPAADTVALAP